ncbi:MAG: HAMP domain-containing sensor histidine kinase [Bacteroidetes bacterium]|nr:HAMP domain-containing sensor histidine kinase [Bacteroidota bacterium]
MKLLTRTSRSYIYISILVFIISGLVFYNLLHNIFKHQLDDTLIEEKMLVEQTINYSDSVPDFRLVFGHMIDVTILNSPQKNRGFISDTLMYDSELGTFASFRHLFTENTSIRHKGYTINIYKPLRDSEKLIAEIVISLALVFVSLLLLLVLVNYFITRRVWIPFYRILHNLSKYEINQSEPLELPQTDIYEFQLLNQTLQKMSKKIRFDYLNLKEFNENAAHELQTPLAIIKSKLELLVQKENLDENQHRLVSAIFEATTRISKLNQGLLLISKIENNQFIHTEDVNLEQLIDKTICHFEEMIDHRGITVSKKYQHRVTLKMNPVLAEIFITNLLSNAIRHNIYQGHIEIHILKDSFTIENTGQLLKTDPRNLFERFRKSANNPDSVGLGLSIVQNIANLYRMKIEYMYHEGLHTLKIFSINITN